MEAGATPPAGTPQTETPPAATPAVEPAPGAPEQPKDANLPDPSGTAKAWSFFLIVATVVAALLLDDDGTKGFDPSGVADADLGFFAGFFLAAQIIERFLEIVAPFIPFWKMPPDIDEVAVASGPSQNQTTTTTTTRSATPLELVARKKADRGYVLLSFGALLGVILSGAMGLYLPEAIGIDVPRWLDMVATGFAVSGGSKGLHELIKALQKAKGTGTTAG